MRGPCSVCTRYRSLHPTGRCYECYRVEQQRVIDRIEAEDRRHYLEGHKPREIYPEAEQEQHAAALRTLRAPIPVPHSDADCPCDTCERDRRAAIARHPSGKRIPGIDRPLTDDEVEEMAEGYAQMWRRFA